MSSNHDIAHEEVVQITPLLKRLGDPVKSQKVEADEIAAAFALIFENRISPVQTAALLTTLHFTKRDKDPAVLSQCAYRMREAASPVPIEEFKAVLKQHKRKLGSYEGGLCDIVGTGGDSHSTFNISTTSSIIASALLRMAKHGNRAQTSMSGSADVLMAIAPKPPKIEALTAQKLPQVYAKSNYVFLFAPNFHSGMKYAAPVRREVGIRTIFNLLGPLANPVNTFIEARLIGVATKSLGPIFAEALRLSGVTKGIVVCGEEELDEISCAGKTNCWMLKRKPNPAYKTRTSEKEDDDETSDDDAAPQFTSEVEHFQLDASDFGLQSHPLSEVGGGKLPRENARVLMSILRNEIERDHPILHFVLMNVAALFVVSGVCNADTCHTGEVIKDRGPGGGRWKEGVRKARWCLETGASLSEFQRFIDATVELQ